MRVKFPYTLWHGINVPIVPAEISGPSGWQNVWGFLDTGATYSILSHEEAQKLGLDYTRGNRIKVVVGDGKEILVYLHNLQWRLANREFKATTGFSQQLGIGFNLFGRKDILYAFRVCLSDRYKEITFSSTPK